MLLEERRVIASSRNQAPWGGDCRSLHAEACPPFGPPCALLRRRRTLGRPRPRRATLGSAAKGISRCWLKTMRRGRSVRGARDGPAGKRCGHFLNAVGIGRLARRIFLVDGDSPKADGVAQTLTRAIAPPFAQRDHADQVGRQRPAGCDLVGMREVANACAEYASARQRDPAPCSAASWAYNHVGDICAAVVTRQQPDPARWRLWPLAPICRKRREAVSAPRQPWRFSTSMSTAIGFINLTASLA